MEHRLIGVFAGRSRLIVGFVRWLNEYCSGAGGGLGGEKGGGGLYKKKKKKNGAKTLKTWKQYLKNISEAPM